MRIVAGLMLTFIIFTSCSKSDQGIAGITGTWIFTNSAVFSYAYPSVLTGNTNPIGVSTGSTSLDSCRITFNSNDSYSFTNFRQPADNGEYTITQDSFLVIKPDTADFVKFNYTPPTLIAITDTLPAHPPSYSPYTGFQYSTDTILFKKTSNNNIVFSGAWIGKAAQPILPGNDTLILYVSYHYFKRQ